MEKSITSIILKKKQKKTRYRRARQSEIWDSRVVLQHMWDIIGLVPFTVVLRSFGVLSIFSSA